MRKNMILAGLIPLLLLGCSSRPERTTWNPASPPEVPSGKISLGITTWNIERFDGGGEGDTTWPTRDEEQMDWLARILLDTWPDIIVLEEISAESPFSETSPLDQLLERLNAQDAKRQPKGCSAPAWEGYAGEASAIPAQVVVIWNSNTVEPVAFAELTQLRVGYVEEKRYPLEELRFPRVPPAVKFRSKKVPDFDLTVIGLHLKARDGGFSDQLDVNDRRRRGELEDLLGEWVLRPERQGALADEDMVILGDFNEQATYLVRLLDQHGTRDDTKGKLSLYPDAFLPDEQGFVFTGALTWGEDDYSYRGNAEKGQEKRDGVFEEDMSWAQYTNVIDQILISSSLLPDWEGKARIGYFDRDLPLSEFVHLSDHRPVSIRFFLDLPRAGKKEMSRKIHRRAKKKGISQPSSSDAGD